jgi:hypothetical protein
MKNDHDNSFVSAIEKRQPLAKEATRRELVWDGITKSATLSKEAAKLRFDNIQKNFHEVIRGRANQLVVEHGLRLPGLEPILEFKQSACWFAVPGMYGGFAYWLEDEGQDAKLITESWCRIEGGSGQRHEITESGSTLVEEGFV